MSEMLKIFSVQNKQHPFETSQGKIKRVTIWEMHGFPLKFPTVWENATKPMVWGKVWKIDTHTFPIVSVFFSN